MADPVLATGQYSIGRDGGPAMVYGGRAGTIVNGLLVSDTQVDPGTITVQDQAVIGHDGLIFGVDTLPGMVVTQTGAAYFQSQGKSALDAYSQLAGAWNDASIRLASGAVQVFRAFYPVAQSVRRCYGRGRKIAPTHGLANQGIVPWTAQFQAADNSWYADTISSVLLTQVPSLKGTLAPPLTPPYQLAFTTNNQQNTAVNAGQMPTWPVITFTGPVTNPVCQFVNTPVSVGYTGSLRSTDTLVIDTRPWARTAMLNGTTSAAGALNGDPMISLQLQPGATLVKFGGQDFTGTSTCLVSWRSAYLSIGGTL
jgi:hypothetical protein